MEHAKSLIFKNNVQLNKEREKMNVKIAYKCVYLA